MNEGNVIHDHGINTIMAQLAITVFTGPKVRFPLCRVYQNMSFLTHIWQRIGQSFNEMCRKLCPILHISYMHEI